METPKEMIDRLTLMSKGDSQWDLSANDQAAIRYVLQVFHLMRQKYPHDIEATPTRSNDNYVAWLRFDRGAIRVCDSDSEGAFKVYRRSPDTKLTGDQIEHMVNRFLSWKLPENFNPDAGISFKATFNEPTGTNLFDATQAEMMIRHMIDEMPS